MYTAKNKADLISGSLWSNIWEISWPIVIFMFFYFLVGLTDIYVAGLISPEIQAAVGFVDQLYFLIIIIANALSVGTLALVSRSIGGGNFQRAAGIAGQSLVFSLLIAMGLSAVGLLFYDRIVSLAGFPEAIRTVAGHFLRIFALALGPNYILIISNAVFRGSGEVKKPLVTMLLVSILNMAGDFVLVFGLFSLPKMGYAGIAVSTALSVTVGMTVNLFFLARGRWKRAFHGCWRLSWETIRKIAGLSWPAAMLQIAWNAGTIVLYNILGRLGSESISALASTTNGLRIEAIIYLPAFALNMAASVLVGQNLGAHNPDRAEEVGWKISQAGVVLISAMALIVFIWAGQVASVVSGTTHVLRETTTYLRINMLSEPFMALSSVLGGGLQGAGDTRGAMWVIIVAMWFVRLPLAYLFALVLGYGAVGVWVAMIISMALQGLLMARRFHRGEWKKITVD